MSSMKVEIVQIDRVDPHPDPETTGLEIVTVKGWQTVIRKGSIAAGVKALYIPVDAVVPECVAERWGVAKYLSKGRVRAAKLRGVVSYGFIIPIGEEDLPPEVGVGDDVSELYGITKYEPPPIDNLDFEKPHPLFQRYTDIEQWQNFPEVFQDGEQVWMSEKIHGTNARYAAVREGGGVKFLHGTHNNQLRPGSNTKYEFPLRVPGVTKLLQHTLEERSARCIILFGEVYGSKVQKGFTYDTDAQQLGFRAFDICVDGQYVGFTEFMDLCVKYRVETVPVLFNGPFSVEKMHELSAGKTTIGGSHVREGVVVKPLSERTDPSLGRVVLKRISDEYRLKDAPDSH